MLMTDVPTYKKILPIELPSMVEAENFSDHPRMSTHKKHPRNSFYYEIYCIFTVTFIAFLLGKLLHLY